MGLGKSLHDTMLRTYTRLNRLFFKCYYVKFSGNKYCFKNKKGGVGGGEGKQLRPVKNCKALWTGRYASGYKYQSKVFI